MSKSSKLKAAVVGANGYTGEELCRLLLRHPQVSLDIVTSRQHAGKSLTSVIPGLGGFPGAGELLFTAPSVERLLSSDADVFFLSLPHGVASEFALPLFEAGRKVIDISADFRLRDASIYEEFYGEKHRAPKLLTEAVYGLPEIYREKIKTAALIASPGCYPTSILLPMIPLLRAGLLEARDICVSAASGTSGAGRKASESLLFSECNESLKAYGLPKHRHLSEIEQELSFAARGGAPVHATFVPHLAPMTRGIHTTIFAKPKAGIAQDDLFAAWAASYADEPFVRFSENLPDTKNISGSNFAHFSLRVDERTRTVVILSAVDNLVKGAGGQAVQSLNIQQGWDEVEGLL
ncbi:MAG: N-acetyl-gamma-glutamyl-phosphate reductase [Chthoniobacterales bacterium]